MVAVKGSGRPTSRESANNFNATARRLNAKDGPIERLADGTEALAQAVDSFNSATLPRVNRVADDTSRAVRRLGRAADGISDNPQIADVRQRRRGRRSGRARLFGAGGVRQSVKAPSMTSMTLKTPWPASLAAICLAGCGALPDKPARAALYDFGPGLAARPRLRRAPPARRRAPCR